MGTAAALAMATKRPSVLIPLRTAESFMDYYTDRGDHGTLFIPGHVDLPPGEEVDIELAFSDPALTFTTRGVVRWKRSKAARNLAAGVGLEFHPDEVGTRDLLIRFARGEPIPQLQQRSRRFPAELELVMMLGGARMRVQTSNISQTGAFISTPRVAEVHSVLPMTVNDGREAFNVDAEVRWIRHGSTPGMGVQFLLDENEAAQHVRKLVEEVRDSLAARRKS